MNAIGLLLDTAIDYERTHQIILYTLFRKSNLAEHLLRIFGKTDAQMEPAGQLFDLKVTDEEQCAYLELKMWAGLSDSQLKRQSAFLKKERLNGYYILLGASWFEYTPASISSATQGAGRKVGYSELIEGLNKVLLSSATSSEVHELALCYRNVLQCQFDKLTSHTQHKRGSRLYYYTAYAELQKRVSRLGTAIYTVNNPGGPVYILNDKDSWSSTVIADTKVKVYQEVVNGILGIKFYSDTQSEKKRLIRGVLRKAVHNTLTDSYKVIDSGRLGAYMGTSNNPRFSINPAA